MSMVPEVAKSSSARNSPGYIPCSWMGRSASSTTMAALTRKTILKKAA